jgi:hypothetical protein
MFFGCKESIPNPEEKGILGKINDKLYVKIRGEYNLSSKIGKR